MEEGPDGRKLPHSGPTLREAIGTLCLFLLLPSHHGVSILLCLSFPAMLFCITTDPKAADPNNHGLKTTVETKFSSF